MCTCACVGLGEGQAEREGEDNFLKGLGITFLSNPAWPSSCAEVVQSLRGQETEGHRADSRCEPMGKAPEGRTRRGLVGGGLSHACQLLPRTEGKYSRKACGVAQQNPASIKIRCRVVRLPGSVALAGGPSEKELDVLGAGDGRPTPSTASCADKNLFAQHPSTAKLDAGRRPEDLHVGMETFDGCCALRFGKPVLKRSQNPRDIDRGGPLPHVSDTALPCEATALDKNRRPACERLAFQGFPPECRSSLLRGVPCRRGKEAVALALQKPGAKRVDIGHRGAQLAQFSDLLLLPVL